MVGFLLRQQCLAVFGWVERRFFYRVGQGGLPAVTWKKSLFKRRTQTATLLEVQPFEKTEIQEHVKKRPFEGLLKCTFSCEKIILLTLP